MPALIVQIAGKIARPCGSTATEESCNPARYPTSMSVQRSERHEMIELQGVFGTHARLAHKRVNTRCRASRCPAKTLRAMGSASSALCCRSCEQTTAVHTRTSTSPVMISSKVPERGHWVLSHLASLDLAMNSRRQNPHRSRRILEAVQYVHPARREPLRPWTSTGPCAETIAESSNQSARMHEKSSGTCFRK